MTTDPPFLPDQLSDLLAAHLREHLWNGPAVRLGDDRFEPLDEEETAAAGGGEFDVVLRAPDGTLFDVRVDVAVAWRERTAVVDRLPAGAVVVDRVLAAEPRETIWAGRAHQDRR
jgi:hypothetical protein